MSELRNEMARQDDVTQIANAGADTDWPSIAPYPITAMEEGEAGATRPPAPPRAASRAARFAAFLVVVAVLALMGVGGAWLIAADDPGGLGSPEPGHRSAQPPSSDAPTTGSPQDDDSSPSTLPAATAPAQNGTSPPTVPADTRSSTQRTQPATAQVRVPSVVGLRATQARSMLQARGLRSATRLVESERTPGTVVGQRPTAGSTVDRGTTVQLRVSKSDPAPTAVTVTVPRLVGMSADAAKSRLGQLGLRWTAMPVTSEQDEGTVVGQSPDSGTALRKGQTVTLRVSTGPALITVPDVVGLDEDSARSQLVRAGFTIVASDEPTDDPTSAGVVLDQDPVGGSDAREGSTVTIAVGRASTSP